MEKQTIKPYLVVIGFMIVTSLALAFTVDVTITDEAGINVFLADRLDRWQGEEMRYCQNALCQKSFSVQQIKEPNVCPECGGVLDNMSRAEKGQLPPDTVLLRKRYHDDFGNQLYAAIVLSGKDRASIHRPQICLVGQGNEIINSELIAVPIEGRSQPLKVMLLDMLWKGRTSNGQPFQQPTFYAYWFVGKNRETPYHMQRMFWMATDRIFHNTAHRWAYISVTGNRDEEGRYKKEMAAFIGKLYPEMALD